MHQHLDAGLGCIELRFHGKALLVQAPAPIVTGDGGQVRIAEERNEDSQTTILKNEAKRQKEGTARRLSPNGHKTPEKPVGSEEAFLVRLWFIKGRKALRFFH